jgi:hypothetical protein
VNSEHGKIEWAAVLLFAALVTASVTGCTVVGALVGSYADHLSSRRVRTTWQHPDSIPPGSKVEILFEDGSTKLGKYEGVFEVTDSAYAGRYNSVRDSLGTTITLPPLGETLSIAQKSGNETEGVFKGFGVQSLIVRRSDAWFSARLPLYDTDRVTDMRGNIYSPKAIEALMAARQLPLKEDFVLRTEGTSERLSLRHIKEVRALSNRTHYWALGAGIGLLIDTAIVIAFVKWQESDFTFNIGAY